MEAELSWILLHIALTTSHPDRQGNKIRQLTSRSHPIPMDRRIQELNHYLMGWCSYFKLAETPTVFRRLDEWLRRRLRMIRWKEWKQPKTRVRQLISMGIPKGKADEWSNTRRKYWRIAKSPILHQTLDLAYWQDQGLLSVARRTQFLRQT